MFENSGIYCNASNKVIKPRKLIFLSFEKNQENIYKHYRHQVKRERERSNYIESNNSVVDNPVIKTSSGFVRGDQ